MGQRISAYDTPYTDLKPGTYRIVNVASKTVIEAPLNDRRKVVGWVSSKQHDKHQMWFVQRAGKGYQFKNCHSGTYFGVFKAEANNVLCASAYPMTWALHLIQGEDTFVLQVPGNDLILNMYRGSTENGTVINIRPPDDILDRRRWKFEHISDESDMDDAIKKSMQELESLKQEHQSLKQELQLKNEEIQRLQRSNLKALEEEMSTRFLP